MKTVNIAIELLSINELTPKARNKAIEHHRNFMLESLYPSDFDGTEEEQTEMYEAECEYIEDNDNCVIEEIEANEYLFFKDGTLAHCTHYCDKHPKAGITELNYMGNVYVV